MRRQANARAGFTLVEVLVALLIFAVLAAAGAAALSAASNTRFAVKAASDRTAQLQRLRGLLRADLGQAAPRRVRAATGRPSPAAMVAGDGVREPLLLLVRAGWTNPDGRARPSLQRVEYRLVDGRLERRASTFLDGARPGTPQVVYRGVRDARVLFLKDGQEAPAFAATPDRPLPDAVRLTATLDGYGPVDQLFLVGSGR